MVINASVIKPRRSVYFAVSLNEANSPIEKKILIIIDIFAPCFILTFEPFNANAAEKKERIRANNIGIISFSMIDSLLNDA